MIIRFKKTSSVHKNICYTQDLGKGLTTKIHYIQFYFAFLQKLFSRLEPGGHITIILSVILPLLFIVNIKLIYLKIYFNLKSEK